MLFKSSLVTWICNPVIILVSIKLRKTLESNGVSVSKNQLRLNFQLFDFVDFSTNIVEIVDNLSLFLVI